MLPITFVRALLTEQLSFFCQVPLGDNLALDETLVTRLLFHYSHSQWLNVCRVCARVRPIFDSLCSFFSSSPTNMLSLCKLEMLVQCVCVRECLCNSVYIYLFICVYTMFCFFILLLNLSVLILH